MTREVRRSNFDGGRVVLDNTTWTECRFIGCSLVITGAGPISMIGCEIGNCRFDFAGPAATTFAILSAFYSAGGNFQEIVEGIIHDISRGQIGKAMTQPTTDAPKASSPSLDNARGRSNI